MRLSCPLFVCLGPMKKRRSSPILVLLSLLQWGSTFLASSQSVQVAIPLQVSLRPDTMYFGVHPLASDSIDLIFGERELPPHLPFGLDVRFVDRSVAPPFLGNGSYRDMRRSYSRYQIDTFKVQQFLYDAGDTVVYRWPANLSTYCDSMKLLDIFNGWLLNINMFNVHSLVAPRLSVAHYGLLIIMYGPKQSPAPPAPPRLVSPPVDSLWLNEVPVLRWWIANGAESYHLQVATDSIFSEPVWNDSSVISIEAQVGPLVSGTDYFWRVRSRNEVGWGTWSSVWKFTTASLVCSAPNLKTWLSVTDANGICDTVWFGVEATATRAIDPWLCEVEYPPPPPVGVFDVRFNGFGIFPFGQGLKQDYRRLSQDALRDTHLVKFQASEPSQGYPITLRWSPSEITAIWDSVVLTDLFWNGWLFWVNMSHQDSFVIQNPGINGITLWTRRHSLTDVTAVEGLPEQFSLSQNYPNPFNPSTRIEYQLPHKEFVSLRVFDVLGREVALLVNEVQSPGTHSVEFSATGLASGVYFYRLESGGFVETKRLVLLR